MAFDLPCLRGGVDRALGCDAHRGIGGPTERLEARESLP
jgi:hypothetical protein